MPTLPALADLRPAARLFKALGDPTRLRIVALLAHGELCVCHLKTALALPQPNVSRHLAVLRAAGLVAARRDGSWMHYRLAVPADPESARHLEAVVEAFRRQAAVRREAGRIRRACGPGHCG